MTQITEDYVSYETALLLKEKGFDIPVRFEYHCIYNVNQKPQFHKKIHNFNGVEYSGLTSKWYSAPAQSLALKWLREVHNFIVTIDYDRYPVDNGENDVVGYGYNIQTKDNPEDYYRISESVYDCYEEAVEAALLYILTNLI